MVKSSICGITLLLNTTRQIGARDAVVHRGPS
jgi:hypothetical protein